MKFELQPKRTLCDRLPHQLGEARRGIIGHLAKEDQCQMRMFGLYPSKGGRVECRGQAMLLRGDTLARDGADVDRGEQPRH